MVYIAAFKTVAKIVLSAAPASAGAARFLMMTGEAKALLWHRGKGSALHPASRLDRKKVKLSYTRRTIMQTYGNA